jgi:hypothetical protein
MADPITWDAVDPTKKFGTGTYAWDEFKKKTGLGDEFKDEAAKLAGYTDLSTGAADFSGAQWNTLGKEWASRTGNVFNDWVAPTPTPTPTPTPNPDPTGAPIDLTTTVTDAPSFDAPTLNQPDALKRKGEYVFNPYDAPTWDEVLANDPGVRARIDEGAGALEASAAAKGNLRGKNTWQGLIDYGQNAAANEYAAADARARATWGANEAGRASSEDRNFSADATVYGANTDAARAAYEAEFQGKQAEYAPSFATWQAQQQAGQREKELNFDRDWQKKIYWNDDARIKDTQASEQQRYWDTYNRDEGRYWDTYEKDDSWRRYQDEEARRRWLAEMGYS